ncbi:MAG: anthranilate synthase component I family protein [Planctomycetes bacterium]|nr:anthranilate synthase component I family protein [Planctomycetota bacterium]NOG54218.1 anthranilate synthase component I family protein [Planctomycetota bacterium]
MFTDIGQDGAALLDNRGGAVQVGLGAGPVLAVQCTPLEAVKRWPSHWPLAVLHSGRFHRQWARWTILARPAARLVHAGGISTWERFDGQAIQASVALTHGAVEDLTRLGQQGGLWIGSLSYDLGMLIEPAVSTAQRTSSSMPIYEWHSCPDVIVYDHVSRRWQAVAGTSSDFVQAFTDRMTSGDPSSGSTYDLGNWQGVQSRRWYEDAVARVVEYIRAGDIFQANLTRRLTADFSGSPRALFVRAMEQSEPWYAAYLELRDNRTLISLSPELFLSFDPSKRRITSRPIKGTLPGNQDARALAASEKDAAELNMIVDLMRNDLGRVCEYGSVRVAGGRTIESHPTVHHGVATVQGRLRAGVGLPEVLAATFPAGSITGAPKIRAMQIIRELEGQARGPFFGSVGVVMPDGGFSFNVSIRTLVIDGDRAEYAAGGGIVADSVPAAEYEETVAKTAVVEGLVT